MNARLFVVISFLGIQACHYQSSSSRTKFRNFFPRKLTIDKNHYWRSFFIPAIDGSSASVLKIAPFFIISLRQVQNGVVIMWSKTFAKNKIFGGRWKSPDRTNCSDFLPKILCFWPELPKKGLHPYYVGTFCDANKCGD